MSNEKGNNDAVNISSFFNDYAEDFSSIYKEDIKKRSSFNKKMDQLFRKDIEIRFDATIALTEKDSIKSVLDIGCGQGISLLSSWSRAKRLLLLTSRLACSRLRKKG